jgi:redox-sensitive bicupin YhaK (pirin superfamily)
MIDPKYRGIEREQIPVVNKKGMNIKVIAGRVNGTEGPVRDLAIGIEYFDVELVAGKAFEHATPKSYTVFSYVVDGSIEVLGKTIIKGQCAIFGEGNFVKIGSKIGGRFLFVSGEPLNEPVAWRGPIVMNTQEELDKAFEELDMDTFIKTKKPAKPS